MNCFILSPLFFCWGNIFIYFFSYCKCVEGFIICFFFFLIEAELIYSVVLIYAIW